MCQHPIHETFENAGINDEKVEKIVLFPNPAGDFIQLEIKDNIKIQKYQIVNSTGALVKESAFSENNISISELSPGYYIFQLFDGSNEKYSVSFIKQ